MQKELDAFCRKHGISVSVKKDQEEAIVEFLKTGKILKIKSKAKITNPDSEHGLTLNTKVKQYKNDPATREFLKQKVESAGGKFTGFSAHLNKWRIEQTSKGKSITYGDLVKKYIYFQDLKKQGKLPPLSREVFQFNAFVSDALKDGLDRKDAVKLWERIVKQEGQPVYRSSYKKLL